MNKEIYTKIINTTQYRKWGDKNIDQFSIWELRDMLTHSVIELSSTEAALVDKIVDGVLNNQPVEWNKTNLSIYGEAMIQQKLAMRGYQLLCFDLNEFPASVYELKQKIAKEPLVTRITLMKDYWLKIINDFCKLASRYITTLIVILGLVYFHSTLIVPALITSIVIFNCFIVTVHDYWSHSYIQPRNRIIGFLFDYISYILWKSCKLSTKDGHLQHHKFWKSENDPTQLVIDRMHWLNYLLVSSNDVYNSNVIEPDRIFASPTELKFLEKFYKLMIVIAHAIVFLVAGVEIYFYFVILQAWLFTRLFKLFGELVPHYGKETKEQEHDMPWLILLCGSFAYHTSHHMYTNRLYLGKGLLRYINPQYYFIKLFYRTNAKEG